MTNSDRILAQHNEAAEPHANPSIDHQTSVGIGAVSGGLAGAVLGNMVAGKLGAAIGAVVGGVAGAAISNEKGAEISHAVEQTVDAAKEKVQPSVMNALDQVESKSSTINPDVANAVSNLKAKVQGATSSSGSNSNDLSGSTYVEDISLDSTVDSMTASAGYTDTVIGYTDSSAGYGVDEYVADTIAEDIHSPDRINSGAAYIEEQTPYESTSSMEYATDAAYSSEDISVVSVEEQYDQGVTLGKQGDLAGAIAAFQSVVAQEPHYAEAHYNLGVVLCKYGLTEQGITHIEQSRTICRTEGREQEAENIDRILQNLNVQ
ncbi:MAG: tetratricopeptide repeat protein [Leptolyngbyaceae cyanobacterium RM2_2_4]|nr:tetratricopeptide repeat protein [Leptolyngbyaceae cyanobacterium SM1_4_3]NJN89721.1 tetratricopeptide repeat protein [Leptolyngbyaceae cyanobacterium SL_5_14]NJO49276.1 tetratricopeptide repeat protein [Leptolyngbyaceae cyanobacterium RM2_2_4]